MLFPLICVSEEAGMLELTKTIPAVYTDTGALVGPVVRSCCYASERWMNFSVCH